MAELPTTTVTHYDHLGLIAAILEEYQLIDRIDSLIPKRSHHQKISHGQAIAAMIYQGLGFSRKRLYSAKHFFNDTPLTQLLGEDVGIDQLNDKVLGRTLDAVYAYGLTKFFSDVAFKTLMEHRLLSDFVHLDSTTLSFHGRGYAKTKSGSITIGRGHSKGRPDLIQLVQCLVTTENGLPFWQQTHSGNTNDRSIFQSSIEAVQTYVKQHLANKTLGFVADSALYSKKFLLNKSITGDWIARVPESIHEAKSILEKNTEKTDWTRINADFKFREIDQSYAGVKQRWMIIENRESKYKDLDTFRRKFDKEEQSLKSASRPLTNTSLIAKRKLSDPSINFANDIRCLRFPLPFFESDENANGRISRLFTNACCPVNETESPFKASKIAKGNSSSRLIDVMISVRNGSSSCIPAAIKTSKAVLNNSKISPFDFTKCFSSAWIELKRSWR